MTAFRALWVLLAGLVVSHSGVRPAPPSDFGGELRARHVIGRPGKTTIVDRAETWGRGVVHELQGTVVVAAGGTLTIEPGTRVEGHPGVGLEITRDGRIVAQGTIYEPIVMTCVSQPRYQGCWRGLSLRGFAVVNDGPFDSPPPRGSGTPGCREHNTYGEPYGGCDDADSSGVLQYVRVEYASHGVELLAVGSGTRIDHLQVNRSLLDGLSVTGGMADLRHTFLTANSGFGLSWRGGWRGRAQFVTIQQDADDNRGGVDGSNAGVGGGLLGAPRSAPRLFNVTIVTPSTGVNPNPSRAMVLREGTGGELRNVILYRAHIGVDVDDDATCQSFANAGPAVFSNLLLVGVMISGDPDAEPGSCASEDQAIGDPGNQNVSITDPLLVAQFLLNGADIVQPDLRPGFSSAAGTVMLAPLPNDGFFEPAAYAGSIAVAASARNNIPWYSGWTHPAPPLPAAGVLTGTVASVQRGLHAGASVTSLTGVQVGTNAQGQYTITLPAGTHVLTIAGLPQGCGADPTTVAVPSGSTGTQDLAVACTVVTSLAVGLSNGCVSTENSSALCWGRNDVGQVGDGTLASPRSEPVAVHGSSRFVSIATGYQHSCAIDNDGGAFCWGLNALGALGNGTIGGLTPTPVRLTGIPPFASITAGSYHNCGLTAVGEAWCWGWNAEGPVGIGNLSSPVTTPQRVVDGGLRFIRIAAGESHTCALTAAGVAYCWGGNARGEAGGDPAVIGAALTTPSAVTGGHTFTEIDGGLTHSCGLTTAGAVLCWGDRESGQLGDGTLGGFTHHPTAVAGGGLYQALSTGGLTSCAVTTAGQAMCWGAGSDGTLGNGTFTAIQATPVPVTGLAGLTRIGVGLSNNAAAPACAVTALSDVFCWGTGDHGQLGDGTVVANRNTPVQVKVPAP